MKITRLLRDFEVSSVKEKSHRKNATNTPKDKLKKLIYNSEAI
jgi:hypothetical protein